jgi:hypothetical protein
MASAPPTALHSRPPSHPGCCLMTLMGIRPSVKPSDDPVDPTCVTVEAPPIAYRVRRR